MKHKYLLAIIAFFVLMTTAFAVVPASAQACVVRTDWATYRVVRGETLFRIAIRYHITTSALAAANCITNINLIYAGQILRVPSGSGDVIPAGSDIPVTFQQYENGFMIWRTDTGDVWVYYGKTSGAVTRYLSRAYGLLPENPFLGSTPPGRVRPIMGFGRVWGNFVGVRGSLGWATNAELSYTMRYSPVSSTVFYFTLPDGRVALNNNQSWGLYSGTIPTSPTPTTPPSGTVLTTVSAAYQLFENGFMLWRNDTGRIDLFTKDYVAGYNLDQYATLPDNPITLQPPAGRVSPINGFGRVWGNFESTRNALGWGLGVEQGYQATFTMNLATSVVCVNLPDGRFVSYAHYIGNRQWMWMYEPSCG